MIDIYILADAMGKVYILVVLLGRALGISRDINSAALHKQ